MKARSLYSIFFLLLFFVIITGSEVHKPRSSLLLLLLLLVQPFFTRSLPSVPPGDVFGVVFYGLQSLRQSQTVFSQRIPERGSTAKRAG